MSLFTELTRLEARYAAAQVSDGSCPRNREILRVKIEDLKLLLLVGKMRVEEIKTGGENDLRAAVTNESLLTGVDALFHLEDWQDEHIRLWEQGC